MKPPADVPSPINLQDEHDAMVWEQQAMQRPYRVEFFQAIADALPAPQTRPLQVLELGSGPGFLAEFLLQQRPDLQLTLLDSSAAMHKLAANRLSDLPQSFQFLEQSFKDDDWHLESGQYDVVITLQAVHELRHKRHAKRFHKQVRQLLTPKGLYLMADHYCGPDAMQNDQLYMSLVEQRLSLGIAGFQYSQLLLKGGRCLYQASTTNKPQTG